MRWLVLVALLLTTGARPAEELARSTGPVTFAGHDEVLFTLPNHVASVGVVDLSEQPEMGIRARAGHLREGGSFTVLQRGDSQFVRVHANGKVMELTVTNGKAMSDWVTLPNTGFHCATGEDSDGVSTRSAGSRCDEGPGEPCYEAQRAMAADARASAAACTASKPSPHAEITIAVVYTQAVALQYGEQDVQRHILHAIEESNDAFRVSGIDAHLRLAQDGNTLCMKSVNYVESGTFKLDVKRLLTQNEDQLSEARQFRRQCHANVGMLLLLQSPGISGYTCVMKSLGLRYQRYAFGAVHYPSMIGSYVFTHELGHMFGAGHERSEKCQTGMCPFSAGYHFDYPSGTTWKTMMAYTGNRALNFSDPERNFNGNGPPTGAPDANNARTLRLSAATVAKFAQ